MKIKGILKKKFEEKTISEKFKKRDFLLTDNSLKYPQDILFQLVNDKCLLLNDLNEGEEIEIDFQINGKAWTSPSGEVKHFNTLVCFAVKKNELF
jgi:hypothetical protein